MSIGVGLAFTLSKRRHDTVRRHRGTGVLADKTFGDVVVLSDRLPAAERRDVPGLAFHRVWPHALRGRRQPRGEPARRHARRSDHHRRLHPVRLAGRRLLALSSPASCSPARRRSGTEAALSSIASVVLGGASLTGGVGGIPGTLIGVLDPRHDRQRHGPAAGAGLLSADATGVILLLGVGFARLREVLAGEQ